MAKARDPLAVSFPAVDIAAWRARVEAELGASADTLTRTTPEELVLEPLYTAADWPSGENRGGYPGAASFVRGAKFLGTGAGWLRSQRYTHPLAEACAEQLKTDLSRGMNAALLVFDEAGRAGRDAEADGAGVAGVSICSVEDLDRALALDLASTPVILEAGAGAAAAAAFLLALAARRGVARDALEVRFGADPLGTLASAGTLPGSLEGALADAAGLAVYCARGLPRARALCASAVPYHDAGAHGVQELAFVLATMAEYLRAMVTAGLDVATAGAQLAMTFPVGRDLFVEIAKLRAARLLWSKLFAACDVAEPPAPWLAAQCSTRTLTRRDPWVNMLRGTTQTFAAIAGGADCITTTAFDEALGEPDALGRRVARNTQLILGQESRLGEVIDPGGGSWFIESLTDSLARSAWQAFQRIEAAGGMTSFLRSGAAAREVEASWQERARRLSRRKDAITGVSEFANLAETLPQRDTLTAAQQETLAANLRTHRESHGSFDLARITHATGASRIDAAVEAAASRATLGEITRAMAEGAAERIEPLVRHRDSELFEVLRDAADAAAERPRVYLANLGPIPAHKARAAFASNFFAAGGIEAQAEDGTGDADAATAAAALATGFRASGAPVACVCGTDADYQRLAPAVASALIDAGAEVVYLAGRPGALEEPLRASGISRFLYLGCDVRAELAWLLQTLKVLS